jgi:hypothetical protein
MKAILLALVLLTHPAGAQTRLSDDLARKDNRALEVTPGLETEYAAVRVSDGYRLRSIVTRLRAPAGGYRRYSIFSRSRAAAWSGLPID